MVAGWAAEAQYTYGVLAFLLICLLAWIYRERSRAVRAERLLSAARRYALGDLSGGPGIRGPDQLGVLADAVDQMAKHLRSITAKLRGREAWIRMLLEHGADLILTLDRDWMIEYAGPSLPSVLGYAPDQVARRPLADLIHPDDAEAVQAAFGGAEPRPGPGEPIAFRMRHADGGWRSMEAVVSHPRDWPGPEHLVITARDITVRERLERRLRQAEQMEALGRFADGAAREVDTLLTAVQGQASFLLFDVAPGDPRREQLEEILRASERAAALTRQLVAFSRWDARAAVPLDLNGVLHELEATVTRLVGDAVAVVIQPDEAVGPVAAEPGLVEQLVTRLVLNAREAMPGGGRLTIRTATEYVAEDDIRACPDLPPARYAVLSIADTGSGIAAENLPRLFDPFFTTRQSGRGAGLGLPTVYGIVKRLGGHVLVRSAPGEGATFEIYLPEATGTVPAPRPAASAAETIVLVEDEDTVRAFAARALERQGYTVLEARDGRDAMERVAAHSGPVHLLVTDVVMPEMTGPDLARHLAAARPDMQVLFLSSHGDGDLAHLGVGPGRAFLRKPFTPEGLAGKVREMLER